MNTPQLAETPLKTYIDLQHKLRRLVSLYYMILILGVTTIYVTGIAAMSEPNGHTGIIYGWIHGAYAVPGLIASLLSDDYSIYQSGGGVWYNFAYLAGLFFMVRNTRIMSGK